MEDSGLFAIEVDTDDYAETAAGDTPAVPRTFQSEQDFQRQKASYTAKIDNGNIYGELMKTVPTLATTSDPAITPIGEEAKRVQLSKKEVHLLGYAVAELYYERKYQEIIQLVERVERCCEIEGDARLSESLKRWRGKCEGRMEKREEA